jgi:hypothetical protein
MSHDRRVLSGRLTALVLVGLAVAVGALVGPEGVRPARAQSAPESTTCPVMTDSVRRLYLAFFNREPTGTEFVLDTTRYRDGEMNLEQLASRLAGSEEFAVRYGLLTDERYVELVYRNVLRRQPTDEDRAFWTTNLASGYDRGPVMLAFSESEEFVRRTGTSVPLSGYLRWYPDGTHWYCGIGSRDDLPIKPLVDPTLSADYLFANGGSQAARTGLQTVLGGVAHVRINDGSLPAGYTNYTWGGTFTGDGDYGDAIDVLAGDNTSWVVVFYQGSIGDQRLGWQIDR